MKDIEQQSCFLVEPDLARFVLRRGHPHAHHAPSLLSPICALAFNECEIDCFLLSHALFSRAHLDTASWEQGPSMWLPA